MRYLTVLFVAVFALAFHAPARALESGETCDIPDDAAQPEVMEELKRILKELSASRDATS